MKARGFILGSLVLLDLLAYLFISAPTPLPEERPSARAIPVAEAFAALNAENAVIRGLYTEEIVLQGQRRGLAFSEHWLDPKVEAGPLPALLLREIGARLERQRVHLGLYLGSDQPIRASNRFEGQELAAMDLVRRTRKPTFYYAEDLRQHTGMFPDVAVSPACIACHNEHPQSPRRDWQLGDVMGATTWTYPAASVSADEFLAMLGAFREAATGAYAAYLEKANHFKDPPRFGRRWPRDGYNLPSVTAWREAIEQRTSAATLDRLLSTIERPPSREAPVARADGAPEEAARSEGGGPGAERL